MYNSIIRLAFLICALALLLGACGPRGRLLTQQEESLTKIPVRSDAKPGSRIISAYDAGVIFANTCLVRGENFDNYAYGLRVHNVTRNAESGIFYHNRYALSVRVQNGECAVRFLGGGPMHTVAVDVGKGTRGIVTPLPLGIEFTSYPATDQSERYYQMKINALVQLPEGWTLNG